MKPPSRHDEPTQISPDDPAMAHLLQRHLELMWASSPACSVHAMDAQALAASDAQFFAVFEQGVAIAMGALKPLSDGNGELKSMHVHLDHRGKGLADTMLARLLKTAGLAGMGRVSLETGSQPVFAPARAFYQRHGFTFCPPFEGYVEDPASLFMKREI